MTMNMNDALSSLISDLPLDMEQVQPNPVYSNNNNNNTMQPPQQQVQHQSQQVQHQQLAISMPIAPDFSSSFDGMNMHFPLMPHNPSPERSISSQYDTTLMPVGAPSSPISDEAVAQIVSNTSVPEFLYQLTKMLTDDHREIIEWSNAKIEVHNPHRLEAEVLNKYFRHSKYASFQRQLNYFGFRKLAGKGKMAPCSYVNENATTDLRSLLRMKRKTSATTKESKDGSDSPRGKKAPSSSQANRISSSIPRTQGVKRSRDNKNGEGEAGPKAKIAVGKGVRHQLNGYLRNPLNDHPAAQGSGSAEPCVEMDPLSLAKSAVGRGITHQNVANQSSHPASTTGSSRNSIHSSRNGINGFREHGTDANGNFTFLDPSQLGMDMNDNLSELQSNYQSSLQDSENNRRAMHRESSLVALAMIPSLQMLEPTPVSEFQTPSVNDMIFDDFPGSDNIGLDLSKC